MFAYFSRFVTAPMFVLFLVKWVENLLALSQNFSALDNQIVQNYWMCLLQNITSFSQGIHYLSNSWVLGMRLNYSDPGFYFSSLYFRLPEETEVAAFDDESASVIRLNNSTVLYMREINKVLALVCILREENFTKPGK